MNNRKIGFISLSKANFNRYNIIMNNDKAKPTLFLVDYLADILSLPQVALIDKILSTVSNHSVI